jgi:hypothetical protein
MPKTTEGYARLPEDLLRDLLEGAEGMVTEVTRLLSPAIEGRERLRDALETLGLVQKYASNSARSVCGVDGGYAVERTAAVDMILSVAVGVEGLSRETTHWDGAQYEWWSRVGKHDLESERLGRGVMVSQELAVLSQAPHEVRILDGSHLTLVIQLNSALTAFSDELRSEACRVWERLGTVEALKMASADGRILAMPKYDSSRHIADVLAHHLDEDIPGDDKYLLGQLLRPGELIQPQRVPEYPWTQLHFSPQPGAQEMAASLQEAIAPLTQRSLMYTYFKPLEFSPAFRLEMKEGLDRDELDAVCSTLAGQVTGPFVREPYPQYLADVMAKSVGLGLSALQSAVQLALGGLGRAEIAELLIHSYRTEGI